MKYLRSGFTSFSLSLSLSYTHTHTHTQTHTQTERERERERVSMAEQGFELIAPEPLPITLSTASHWICYWYSSSPFIAYSPCNLVSSGLPSSVLTILPFSWQISRSGRIIPEKEYQLNTMKKDHQKYIRECLAQAIFHKVLDMEVWLSCGCFF